MKSNDLEERIRIDVKEKIAVSNIKKEFDMKNHRNKKIIYGITSSVAVFSVAIFIVRFGVIRGTNTFNNTDVQNPNYEIVDLGQVKQNGEESLKIDLQINKIEGMGAAKFDADIETTNLEKLPNELNFMENVIIPQEFKLTDMYKVYVRRNQDIKKYDLLHDYVFVYEKNDENGIRVALSTAGEPIRDYYIGDNGKVSKIGEIELRIFQYEKMYMATFKIKDMYFDIETNGITENELVELLKSIIDENEVLNNTNMNSEDKDRDRDTNKDADTNVKEQSNENVSVSENYPEYYAGKYVDNNGNNVVLLCENNEINRKAICSLLEITEGKTIFKTAKYSYRYLTELQNEISQKMIDKEFDFVTSSAVMEDSNNIKVIVTSNDEGDWNRIKALDTIGGTIDIEYNTDTSTKQDLLIEKE